MKAKLGRPAQTLDLKILAAAAARNKSVKDAAEALEISSSTLKARLRDDSEVACVWRAGKSAAALKAKKTIAAMGDEIAPGRHRPMQVNFPVAVAAAVKAAAEALGVTKNAFIVQAAEEAAGRFQAAASLASSAA